MVYSTKIFGRWFSSGGGLASAALIGTAWLAVPAVVFADVDVHHRIAVVEASISSQPAAAGLRVKLAELLCEHEDWPAALVQLDHADELAPGEYATDFLRAQACLALGRAAEAKAAMDRFLSSHAGHSSALIWRARAEKALGETEAALADYRAALRTAAQPSQDVLQEAAEALIAQGLTGEAIGVVDAGMAKVGATPPLVLLAIDFEVAAGRVDAALARIDAMQRTAPRAEPWMVTRATVLARAGRADDARIAWQTLRAHLAALPAAERSSHAMSMIAEQAQQALAHPDRLSPPTTTPAVPTTASSNP